MTKRIRLDQLVVQAGHAESREMAQRFIRAGEVRVNGQVQTKPGHEFPEDVHLEISTGPRFVSRGGEKLEEAIQHFGIEVKEAICVDIGSSTGGFTDCLLKHGATKVYAFDVGHGQLHWKLRQDKRVISREEFNARYLRPADLPEKPTIVTIDVSFISLTLILSPAAEVLLPGGKIIALIKPQFEAGKEQVGRGGVVRDAAVHQQVIEKVKLFGESIGLKFNGVCPSPIKGPAGNIEFLAYFSKQAT